MSEDALKENLRRIICEVGEIDEVPDGASFQSLGLDSMMAIEIVADIERTYQIKVPENELQQITNLDSVYSLVQRHLAAKQSDSATRATA